MHLQFDVTNRVFGRIFIRNEKSERSLRAAFWRIVFWGRALVLHDSMNACQFQVFGQMKGKATINIFITVQQGK
jgi:hypothetical protein